MGDDPALPVFLSKNPSVSRCSQPKVTILYHVSAICQQISRTFSRKPRPRAENFRHNRNEINMNTPTRFCPHKNLRFNHFPSALDRKPHHYTIFCVIVNSFPRNSPCSPVEADPRGLPVPKASIAPLPFPPHRRFHFQISNIQFQIDYSPHVSCPLPRASCPFYALSHFSHLSYPQNNRGRGSSPPRPRFVPLLF
jgi:hypothetical protein